MKKIAITDAQDTLRGLVAHERIDSEHPSIAKVWEAFKEFASVPFDAEVDALWVYCSDGREAGYLDNLLFFIRKLGYRIGGNGVRQTDVLMSVHCSVLGGPTNDVFDAMQHPGEPLEPYFARVEANEVFRRLVTRGEAKVLRIRQETYETRTGPRPLAVDP